MGYHHPLYTNHFLDQLKLKPGEQLHKEFSKEIVAALEADPEIRDLITTKAVEKYNELVKRR